MSQQHRLQPGYHLEKISERGGHEVREAVESKLSDLYVRDGTEIHTYPYEVEQPIAEEITTDIARFNMEAHAELGNAATEDAVWRRSVELSVRQAELAYKQDNEAAKWHALRTLVSMQALEYGDPDVNQDPNAYAEYKIFLQEHLGEHRDDIINSLATVEDVGLCVPTTDQNGHQRYDSVYRFARTLMTDAEDDANEARYMNDRELTGICNEILALGQEGEFSWTTYTSGRLVELLQSGNYSNESVNKLLESIDATAEMKPESAKSEFEIPSTPDFLRMAFGADGDTPHKESRWILDYLPDKKAKELYFAESAEGEEKSYLKSMLATLAEHPDSMGSSGISTTANFLKRAYGRPYALGLYYEDAAKNDTFVQMLLQKQEMQRLVINGFHSVTPDKYEERSTYRGVQAEYVRGCLEKVVGVPHGLASEWLHASYQRLRPRDQEGNPSGDDMSVGDTTSAMYKILALMKHEDINSDALAQLREQAGIVNLDYYSPEQLLRMKKVCDGDPEAIHHLQEGDVTVVFGDAKGDHNGALASTARVFDSERALFFEINQPSDFYRHSIMLNKLGVHDSTRVISTHGSPGSLSWGTWVSGNPIPFQIVTGPQNKDITTPQVSIEGAKGVARIAEEFMQPSKGVDDPEEFMGRKRIIIAACSGAVPGRDGARSVAEQFAWLTRESGTIAYGADRPVGITQNADGNYAHWDNKEKGYTPITATHIDSNGQATSRQINSLQLRKREA